MSFLTLDSKSNLFTMFVYEIETHDTPHDKKGRNRVVDYVYIYIYMDVKETYIFSSASSIIPKSGSSPFRFLLLRFLEKQQVLSLLVIVPNLYLNPIKIVSHIAITREERISFEESH